MFNEMATEFRAFVYWGGGWVLLKILRGDMDGVGEVK